MLALKYLLSVFSVGVVAQSTTTHSTTASSPAATASSSAVATANPGLDGYSYLGCYNETTGVEGTGGARALAGGQMESNDTTASISTCLSYCSGYQYAGLEYSQECWCSNYLSSFSEPLEDSNCALPCKGNETELCGGYLAITLYNLTDKKAASAAAAKSGAAGTVTGEWWYVVGAGVMALGLGWGL